MFTFGACALGRNLFFFPFDTCAPGRKSFSFPFDACACGARLMTELGGIKSLSSQKATEKGCSSHRPASEKRQDACFDASWRSLFVSEMHGFGP